MDSLFEPSYLDPLDAASSSFLSFSALDDLASPFDAILSTLGQSPAPSFSAFPSSSAPSLPSSSSSMSGTSWGLAGPSKLRSPESAHSSETDSPLPVDPLDVFIAAFEPVTPPADCGIFHDGSTGSHKLSGADSQPSYFSHRSSGSASTTESWASPVSPHAFRKGAIETPLARFANPADLLLSSSPPSGSSIPFSWDAASITLGSTSYAPPTTPTPLRVASNPTLGAAYRNPHRLKAVPSLSSLPEDKSVGLSLDEHDSSALLDDPTSAAYWTEDGLATISEGNWLSRIQAGAVPADATIYASEDVTAAQSQMNNLPLDVTEKDFDAFELAASGGYTTMAPVYNLPPSFEASSQAEGMYAVGAVPPTYAAETYERPTSNPLPEFGVQASQMSSAQNGEAMQRSMTAPFIGQPHSAPSGGLFTNAPQIYNGERIGTQKQLFNSAPLVREHLAGQGIDPRLHAAAGQHRPLQVQIHPPAHSTFVPASASVQHSHSAPLQMSTPHRRVTSFAPAMTRASTQPLPPPQQMTSVTYGQQPASYDWQTAGGVLSSMGPGLPQGVNQVQSQWSPLVPNQQLVHSTPVVQAPIVSRPAISPPARTTVHPPPHPNGPAYATGQHLDATAYAAMTASQMRVHPPPGTLSVHPQKYRPMAALPRRAATSMARSASAAATMEGASLGGGRVTSRRASVTPKKGKAAKMAPLSFDDCFVNFTPEDGAQLRAAVAPSGSASKRKREAAAAAAAADVKRRNSHAGTASPPSPSPAPAAAAPAAKKPRHQE